MKGGHREVICWGAEGIREGVEKFKGPREGVGEFKGLGSSGRCWVGELRESLGDVDELTGARGGV